MQNNSYNNEWKSEELRIARKSNLFGVWVSILTYCGGSGFGSFLAHPTEIFMSNLPLHLFPIPLILTAYFVGEKYFPNISQITGHAIGFSLSSSVALVAALEKTPDIIYFDILSNIPVYVTFVLIVFWAPSHSLIFLIYSVLINLCAYFILSDFQNVLLLPGWLMVMPIAIGSYFLAAFRYTSTKRNFLITMALNHSNKALVERNHEIEKQKEEISAQRDDIEKQKKIIELKNEQITESINYASRIQMAILPDIYEIKKVLPDCFIYYKPKDIVSGDFYWAEEKNDYKKLFIAVADCTGHGIPGSLMAMIGANLLNQIVNELLIDSPEEILNILDKRIRNLLKQNEKGSELRDGMDISLVVIDKTTQMIRFASANRPLYITHPQGLTEIKGDKIPIGSDHYKEEKIFTLHQIPMIPGQRFYMFSDGIIDQFNAEDNARLGSKRWKEFLLNLHSMDFEKAEGLINQHYTHWKGETVQTDDVLVTGFQL